MSKYNQYKDRVKKMYKEGLSSDAIALIFFNEGNDLLVSAFGRQIRRWASEEGWSAPTKKIRSSKILVFDIETAPILCYVWGKWQQNVNDDMILQDWFVLSWSAKWLFDGKMYSASLKPHEIEQGNDERIMISLWAMLDEADIIIAHNLKKFDQKRVQTRFLKYGLDLPSPYQSIDTLSHLRKKFSITSNRLDYVAKNFLGIAGKMETPKGLWNECMKGNEKAMETMVEYCEQDVRVLEDVYLKIRPYIQPHPNIGLIEGAENITCACCGSEDLKLSGLYRTYVNEFDVLRCNDCGSLNRHRKNSTPKKVRDSITVSIPQ